MSALHRARCGLAAVLQLLAVAGARAQDAQGVWTRDDGAARVQIAPCGAANPGAANPVGPALCGAVVWLKSASSKAHVGQKVFFDMLRVDPNSWSGKAFKPEDGKTYSGRMELYGKKLKTSGCMLGGLICKTVLWRRAD
jgi:uncharacterized protein (DUF2147 family)